MVKEIITAHICEAIYYSDCDEEEDMEEEKL
jgi:hypothetical protein